MATERRLIDANEFMKEICGRCNEAFSEEPCEPAECHVRLFLEIAPTVDAVEVVHGQWKPVYDEEDLLLGIYYKIANACSACGKTVGWLHDSYAYCPNCGAKMDGDGNG